jgi:hypothetical protein
MANGGVRYFVLFLGAVLLGGCVTMPQGPSVMVLPTPGKPLELFEEEDAWCRSWARQRIGMSPQEIADQNAVAAGAAGTAVGAVVGAAIGAASGHASEGALVGAGTGLLLGASSGAEAGAYYGAEAQHRYDIAYQQCMYAKGNQIPAVVRAARPAYVTAPNPPPPSSPPAGYPPPPTPGATQPPPPPPPLAR